MNTKNLRQSFLQQFEVDDKVFQRPGYRLACFAQSQAHNVELLTNVYLITSLIVEASIAATVAAKMNTTVAAILVQASL